VYEFGLNCRSEAGVTINIIIYLVTQWIDGGALRISGARVTVGDDFGSWARASCDNGTLCTEQLDSLKRPNAVGCPYADEKDGQRDNERRREEGRRNKQEKKKALQDKSIKCGNDEAG
jgi:hypothetical protein